MCTATFIAQGFINVHSHLHKIQAHTLLQVQYPFPAGADRGKQVYRPKSAAPVLNSSPIVLPRQRKHPGSLRYVRDASSIALT